MASAVTCNDESKLANSTEAVPITEAATKKTPANDAKIDVSAVVNSSGNDGGIESNQKTFADTTAATTGGGDADGQHVYKENVANELVSSSTSSSPIAAQDTTGSVSATNSTVSSPQTPTSAPRTKPLEKPKPLKLADNAHQQQQHQHSLPSQILFRPGAPAGYHGLGGTPMMGAIPHSILVGGAHLPQPHGVGAFAAHIQSAAQQHGQQQQNVNHLAFGNAGDAVTAVSNDEILDTMEQINRSVKAGQFSTTLAGHIFRLYGYLKHLGELLEQSHKTEMNRVFVSLRQACCRDSGQLGTPCRLKIMELVELRAMQWRPNLSHSQYYLNRLGGSITNGFSGTMGISGEYNPLAQTDGMSGGDMEQLGAAPVSAPPFGTLPINPFAFNLPPTSLAAGTIAPVASAADLVSTAAAAAAATMTPAQGPSYYLIPASHVGHTQAGIAFISPTAAATVLPPPPISPLAATTAAAAVAAAAAAHQQRLHMPASASLSQPSLNGNGINASTSPTLQAGAISSGAFPKGAVTKASGKYSRPTRIPGKSQYRDEVVIRNADSGKIMGVKGRRVAIIEELSKTIISFQKVPQGAKERTLTITGPSEESIEQAKMLIEDTIRRNVSPNRGDEEGDVNELYRGAAVLATRMDDDAGGSSNDVNAEESSEDGQQRAEHAIDGGADARQNKEFTLEAGQLGEMLKLQCSDPALLEAAKQALAAYFSGQQKPQGHQALRRSTTDSASRDQERKERRKSMPALENQQRSASGSIDSTQEPTPQEMQPEKEDKDGEGEKGGTSKPLTLTMMISPPIGKQKASSARSTPNLAAGYNKRALAMMKSVDSSSGGDSNVETKYMADETGGGTLVIHEKESRVTVRVVYTREFVLRCASSPFAAMSPAGLPWMTRETPEILRQSPGQFDIDEYKQMLSELKQLHQ